ncbi:MAG TPA: aldo/keto reductase, partial [Candidatus Binatia bacterium]
MPYAGLTRRDFLRGALGAGLSIFSGESAMADAIIKKSVPQTGELLPAIGLGTWQTFNVGSSKSVREPLRQVMREFVRLGGSVIDSSPMYGKSESVTGD